MKKEDLVKTIDILKLHAEAPACVIQALQKIVDDDENDPSDIILIDRGHYYASILWQEDDIRSELRDQGYEASDENVEEVLSCLDIEEMENCSQGWDRIYDAIYKAAKESVLVKKEKE